MKKEERLKELEVKIEALINELWDIIPESPMPEPYIVNTQDRLTHNLRTAAAYTRDLVKRYSPKPTSLAPETKLAVELKPFVEIDAANVAGKVGWEMEACYKLLRSAQNSEGHLVLASNDGRFDGGIETFEVGISMHKTGDFKSHNSLTREEADKIFESYL